MPLRRAVAAFVLTMLTSPALAVDSFGEDPSKSVLDEIPGYVEALVDQWRSRDLSPKIEAMIADTSHYGRLRPAPAKPLSLADCVALALANNTGLQISRLGPLGARAAVRRAQSVFDPLIFGDFENRHSVRPAGSALAGAQTSRDNNFDVTLGAGKLLRTGGQVGLTWVTNRLVTNSAFLSLRPQYTTDLVATLNQPLLRNFGLHFTTLLVRIARVAESSARKQYEADLGDLVQNVEIAYWTVIGTKENVTAQEQGVVAAKELLRQNEGKFSVGTVPRTAVLEAQAEVARREADRIQAQNAHSIAEDALRAVINAPEEDDLLINVSPADAPIVEPLQIDLEQSLAAAIERRPELDAAKLAVEQRAMELRVAENQLLPKLDAVGAIGTNGLAGTSNPISPTIFGGDPNSPPVESPFVGSDWDAWRLLADGRFYTYSFGLTLEMPLSNAQAKADYSLSRVNLSRARLELRRLQETITLEIKRASTNLVTDLKSLDARQLARELGEENVRNQQARYDVGLATTKDLLDFQDALTQARAAEIRAKTKYLIDLAVLRRVEGTLLNVHSIELDEAPEADSPWWTYF